jgi:hypothetical protein
MDYVNVVGLACDIVGAVWLAWGLFLSKDDAIALGVSRISGDTREEKLQLPAVRDRMSQSRNAKVGTAFLVLGFLLQIVANWPRW